MSGETNPPRPRFSVPHRIVRCGACGRSVECTITDLLRYTREGWPKCCGQVMAFFTEAARPGPNDLGEEGRAEEPT
ncbi:MAG: hypothetical protein J0I06_19255 [Planctomycetes bacterium]|nr:hypothetical protein [Planctomycetota bacterium]